MSLQVEIWGFPDTMDIMVQVGAIPYRPAQKQQHVNSKEVL